MTGVVLEPDLPIIDPHQHFYPSNHWAKPPAPYLFGEFVAELASGHNFVSTVYVECSQMYRQTGPEHLRTVGEAEFAAVMARLSATGHFGPTRIAEGFVGSANLAMGDRVDEVLDALMEASEGRLRGIRFPATWDADPRVNPGSRAHAPKGILADPTFRAGVAQVFARGLVYDAWQYYPQLPELADLAAAFPDGTIAVCHCGGYLGLNAYANPDNFNNWKAHIFELAKQPNLVIKLGALSDARTGLGLQNLEARPSEEELAAIWGPFILTCIEAFGADRCMFESNYPVDIFVADYGTIWNVFKRIVQGASSDEKAALFSETARRTYKLT